MSALNLLTSSYGFMCVAPIIGWLFVSIVFSFLAGDHVRAPVTRWLSRETFSSSKNIVECTTASYPDLYQDTILYGAIDTMRNDHLHREISTNNFFVLIKRFFPIFSIRHNFSTVFIAIEMQNISESQICFRRKVKIICKP